MGGLNSDIVIPPAENYVIITGTTKLKQLNYRTLKEPNNPTSRKNRNLKKEAVNVENSRFRIKLMQGDGYVTFYNDKDEVIYMFRSL